MQITCRLWTREEREIAIVTHSGLLCHTLRMYSKECHTTVRQEVSSSDVLTCPGEMRECLIVLDDPPVHVTGHGACAPSVSMALNLAIELCVFLLKLESRFLELLVLCFQLLHPHARWGRCLPLGLIIEAVHWGSILLVDAFDVPLGGTCHEAFTRGVMAPPAGVKARGRLWLLYEEVMERLRDMFDHPHELVVCGGWDHVLRHKVANDLCGIAETEWEHCWGSPDEAF